MNEALSKYEDKEKVMHISGYMYPIKKEGLPDTFFLKPTSCLGWATWKRAWKFFERNPQKQITALSKEQIKDFNLNNSYDYWAQVVLNYKGKLHTWAIFWYLSVYLRGGLSLHPRESLTKNIGADGSGTHFSSETSIFDVELTDKDSWEFPEEIVEHPLARRRLEDFFNKMKPPFWRRIASKFLPEKLKKFLKNRLKLRRLLNIFHRAIIKHEGVKMNLVELVQVTSSEEEPEKFLRAKGILKAFDRCSFSGHPKIGRVRRSFFKCYGCRKEWCIRKDSILEGLKGP
jgi:hypothetical protein